MRLISYKNVVKRIIDFTIALIGIVILFPLLVLITVILSIEHRGYPFFIQLRPGKDEKLFKLIKFKSMRDVKNTFTDQLTDGLRITRIGAFLRKTSLDELTQLFNVLKGEMSIIGPRPLLPEYLPYFSPTESLRHDVKPGITGLAQVSGRNVLAWDKRLQADVFYVQNLSFKLDIVILLKTVKIVLLAKDLVVDQTDLQSFFQSRRGKYERFEQ